MSYIHFLSKTLGVRNVRFFGKFCVSLNVRNGFLMFSSGIEMEHWQYEIDWIEQKDRPLSCYFLRYLKKNQWPTYILRSWNKKKKKEKRFFGVYWNYGFFLFQYNPCNDENVKSLRITLEFSLGDIQDIWQCL